MRLDLVNQVTNSVKFSLDPTGLGVTFGPGPLFDGVFTLVYSNGILLGNTTVGGIMINNTASSSGGISILNNNNGNISIANYAANVNIQSNFSVFIDGSGGIALTTANEAIVFTALKYVSIAAGLHQKITEINSGDSPYPLGYDNIVLADTTGGDIEADLPSAAATDSSGTVYSLKNTGLNDLDIVPNGGDLIDGGGTITLGPNEFVKIICDGTGWWII